MSRCFYSALGIPAHGVDFVTPAHGVHAARGAARRAVMSAHGADPGWFSDSACGVVPSHSGDSGFSVVSVAGFSMPAMVCDPSVWGQPSAKIGVIGQHPHAPAMGGGGGGGGGL